MKHIASLIIALLLVVSGVLGYSYHQKSTEAEDAKSGLLSVSNTAMFCLTDMDALVTMVENNVSDSVIRERVSRYTFCALMLSEASASLYDATGEKIYWDVHVASTNLADFFNHVRNQYSREGIERNADLFEELGEAIFQVYDALGKGNLTETQTERLLNLAKTLSW